MATFEYEWEIHRRASSSSTEWPDILWLISFGSRHCLFRSGCDNHICYGRYSIYKCHTPVEQTPTTPEWIVPSLSFSELPAIKDTSSQQFLWPYISSSSNLTASISSPTTNLLSTRLLSVLSAYLLLIVLSWVCRLNPYSLSRRFSATKLTPLNTLFCLYCSIPT